VSASADAVGRMLETVDRLSRRLNALEAEKRDAPPFQRGPVQPQRSPEQRFQDSEYAAGRLTEVT